MEKCYFLKVDKCVRPESSDYATAGPQRVQTIINCSKKYDDNLHQELQECPDKDSDYSIRTHRICVSTYTSKQHVERFLKRKGADVTGLSVSPRKRRRSSLPDFDFQKHCLFCGETCNVNKDPKHPTRWRKAYLCRTVGDDGTDLKQEILKVCKSRGDKWAEDVCVRVHGALSDLHAADARYHDDCKLNFMSPKMIRQAAASATTSAENIDTDLSFEQLISVMIENQSSVWNSIDLFNTYKSTGGDRLTRRQLIQSLVAHFDEELLVLTASGVASIIVFKHKAPALLKLVSDSDDTEKDASIAFLAKEIVKETNGIEINKNTYETRLQSETVEKAVSDTLMDLLANLSKKLDHSPAAYLIGNIITSTLKNSPTALQIALGVLMRNSKALISQLNAFGVTCSYDEILRFKKSAAVAATSANELQGISNSKDGLIQVVVDNFDADISSPNGKLSTHSLAVLVTQPQKLNQSDIHDGETAIRRVEKTDMTSPIDYHVNIEHYDEAKKPEMPENATTKCVLSLKGLAEMAISSNRAHEMDMSFFSDIVKAENCPEFNGYNTQICRDQGHVLKSKTKAMYLPLIDMTPSDPDTIMTALKQAQEITNKCGQEFVVFTGDLQLYRVAVNILWAYPDQFGNIILRLGGMHTLMSFVGSIGTLMAGSGLYELLESTFGGVQKMMIGKKFPQNVRALRIVAEELLKPVLLAREFDRFAQLDEYQADISRRSRTSHLWVDCVIKAMFIMMMYIRAEREADFGLHMVAVKAMIPYFFAAGHVYYLRSMEAMPQKCRDKFLKGEHVMRHIPGVWNGIWSDMYIETTFMRYGHGKRGIIGVTLKPETLKVWSLSLHICSRIEQDLQSFINPDENEKQDQHKEEMKGRIASDKSDRESIAKKLQNCIDPLNPDDHPPELVNIVLGKIAQDTVNVDKAVEIGSTQMKDFEHGWPKTFNEKISRSVITQAESRKGIKVGDATVFDTELIYSRVIGLQASSREIDIKLLLSYELSPVPTSMFTDSGEMRTAKAKSVLKQVLQKEVSSRSIKKQITTVVIDGSAILYILQWPPMTGTVGDFVKKYRNYVERRLASCDVYLVFDRYRDYSTKSVTRISRGAQLSRVHQLTNTMPIPPQKVILTIPENKQQLIALIVEDLSQNVVMPANVNVCRRLVVTGEDAVPVEITSVARIHREDLRTTHEEADNILAQQMVHAASQTDSCVSVISDDTDVFVLLLYHYFKEKLTGLVVMESPVQGRAIIDIRTTVNANKDIISDLPAAHALSGSDTTACYYGIGKGTVVKVLRSKTTLIPSLGDLSCPFEDVLKESTSFIAACYNTKTDETDMSSVRQKVWSSKVGKAPSCAPKLCSIPPTSEAFGENVKRAHLQASIWRKALDSDPPESDRLKFGWNKNEQLKALVPVMLPKEVPLAPQDVLKLIKCSCESQSPCGTLRCGCNSSRLSCTVFCACQGSPLCCNERTKHP